MPCEHKQVLSTLHTLPHATAAAVALLAGSTADAQLLRLLPDLPGGIVNGAPTQVSDDGRYLCGISNGVQGDRPVRWDARTGEVLELSGGVLDNGIIFSANAINGDGSVIVGQVINTSTSEAFRWVEGTGTQSLGDLPGGPVNSTAVGVSADGTNVACRGSDDLGLAGFVWSESEGIQVLPRFASDSLDLPSAISSDGFVVVGSSLSPFLDQSFGVLWPDVQAPVLLDGVSLGAVFPTDATPSPMDLVGFVVDQSGRDRAFVIAGGKLSLLELAGAATDGSIANACSDDVSVIVGTQIQPDFSTLGVIWRNGGPGEKIADLLLQGGHRVPTGVEFADASAVSSDGRFVVGTSVNLNSFEVRPYILDLAQLNACSLADVTATGATLPGQPGFGEPDGDVDLDDLGYYLDFWLQGLPRADVTTTGATLKGQLGFGVPDSNIDLDDLGYFLGFWLAGCP
ncbi:MAG: GC-type dockerin domain-anchored protein [Planctomycetota bacterium]